MFLNCYANVLYVGHRKFCADAAKFVQKMQTVSLHKIKRGYSRPLSYSTGTSNGPVHSGWLINGKRSPTITKVSPIGQLNLAVEASPSTKSQLENNPNRQALALPGVQLKCLQHCYPKPGSGGCRCLLYTPVLFAILPSTWGLSKSAVIAAPFRFAAPPML